MTKKGGDKKVTLNSVMQELQKINQRIGRLEEKNEEYFTALQNDITCLQTDVASLKTDVTEIKTELKDFRAETNSSFMGMGTKFARHDAFQFKIIGILQEKNILSPGQAGELRAI